jgi:hypothetical protein
MKRIVRTAPLVVLALACLLLSGAHAATFEELALEHGDAGREFRQAEIGGKLVYFHQRMLGPASVEKDFIVYQLDPDTGELLARKGHWRDDLPEELPELHLSREEAEAMAVGDALFSRLYMISPESDVFPLDPPPVNPCWVVRSVTDAGEQVVSVIDAVEVTYLGPGVPPPYAAFSLTGPQHDTPCSGAWDSWSGNADTWFNTMGYSTEEIIWPEQSEVQARVQSTTVAMFYELAHGGSSGFASGCIGGEDYETTFASEIESWIASYGKMPFAFVGSCGGMCDTGNNSLSFEFRKGSSLETTTVGYCNMAAEFCGDCWTTSIAWQTALFGYMNEGYAVKAAHDQANADFPQCGVPACMRFAGDPTFVVVPPVARLGAPWTDFTHPVIADLSRGAGVAWGDYDGDGDLDIYLVNSDSANKLFSYVGGGVFFDATTALLGDPGAGTAVASADYDNDGDLDIYLVNEDGPNRLFVNDGAGGFTDGAGTGPLADASAGYGASWADFDSDGYVDLYIVNDGPNRLLRNSGPPTWAFTDVTLPPLDDARKGRTAAWADYDNDGDQDLYLTRSVYSSRLFRNEGAGVFTDATVPALADSGITMGAAWGDYDNDGDLDLYLTKMWNTNRLIRNDGGGAFSDATSPLLADADDGMAVAWVDTDNDGHLDLHVVNYNDPDRLFRNEGGGEFVDASDPPLNDDGSGWGAAWADFDDDGDCDVYVSTGTANRLFWNQLGNLSHWLKVELEGTASNRSAIGARVRVVAGGHSQIREITSGSGNFSQNSLPAEFGLGDAAVVDTLEIRWPLGLVERATDVAADQFLEVREGVWTGIAGAVAAGDRAVLHGNSPNPFNPVTLIQYELPTAGRVDLAVYDLSGRLVRTLVAAELLDAGRQTAPWNGRDDDDRTVASGVYFYRLEVGGEVLTKRMVLLI